MIESIIAILISLNIQYSISDGEIKISSSSNSKLQSNSEYIDMYNSSDGTTNIVAVPDVDPIE